MKKFTTVPLADVPGRIGRGQHPFWRELMKAVDEAYASGEAVFVQNKHIPGSLKSADAAIRRAAELYTQGFYRASIRAADGGRYIWLVLVDEEEA